MKARWRGNTLAVSDDVKVQIWAGRESPWWHTAVWGGLDVRCPLYAGTQGPSANSREGAKAYAERIVTEAGYGIYRRGE